MLNRTVTKFGVAVRGWYIEATLSHFLLISFETCNPNECIRLT